MGSLAPPQWATELVADGTAHLSDGISGRLSSRFLLGSLRVPDCNACDGDRIEQATFDAYVTIWRYLQSAGGIWHPVRIWNYVPFILATAGEGLDRYMRFNAGRHRAFDQWFGGVRQFDRVLPAASAVGHSGSDLWIHVLACRNVGTAVTNPRQCAPHRYSRRFGPLPPCFSRAMLVEPGDGRRLLLVGGTASIRGEESVHIGKLAAQLEETTENLKAVAMQAFGTHSKSLLDCYTDLRVYHPRSLDRPEIDRHILSSFRSVRQVEWLQGDLCRSDLLVEIEALGTRLQD